MNDETNDDDYLTDDVFAENDDEDEDESLHEIPDEAVFVAEPGVSLDEMNDDDSPTNDVLNDVVVNPPEVEDSPSLFSVDTTGQNLISNSQAVKSTTTHSGRKPTKIMEVNIPLRNPTQPTLVSGKKTEKKRDNTGMSDQETSPKKNRLGPCKKKRK